MSREPSIQGVEVGACGPEPLPVVVVEDLADPRLAGYRDLKDATLAARDARFVVEGRISLEALLESPELRPESILLSERAHAGLAGLLAARRPDCPVFVAPAARLERIVGFPIHRGVLALGRRPPPRDPLELADAAVRAGAAAERPPRLVALEALTNHDNVGGVFRNARAFGAAGVILCPRSCDPLYRKAIRTSLGATLRLPFARAPRWPDALEALRDRGFEILALDPGAESASLDGLDAEAVGPAVLLLGTEGPGLSEAARRLADRRLRIDMEPGIDSLNVAVAAGIALHRLRPQDGPAGDPGPRPGASRSLPGEAT